MTQTACSGRFRGWKSFVIVWRFLQVSGNQTCIAFNHNTLSICIISVSNLFSIRRQTPHPSLLSTCHFKSLYFSSYYFATYAMHNAQANTSGPLEKPLQDILFDHILNHILNIQCLYSNCIISADLDISLLVWPSHGSCMV